MSLGVYNIYQDKPNEQGIKHIYLEIIIYLQQQLNKKKKSFHCNKQKQGDDDKSNIIWNRQVSMTKGG